MRKPLIVVLPLALLSGTLVEGFFYSAHAQCAPTDKIYIDPRLVPRRPQISQEQYIRMGFGKRLSPEEELYWIQQMRQQNEPIVVPYGTGKVLVHPTNPCIQQYIP
jgi:hypothetical protein